MRYNESMRDHNHRICCYLNCSVSYLKNAHRYHEKYLMRAMTMMSMMLYKTKDSVLVVDDSRCDRHGMITLKATLCWKKFSFFFLFFSLLQSAVLFNNDNDDDVFRWTKRTDSSVGGKKYRFSFARSPCSTYSASSSSFSCLSPTNNVTEVDEMEIEFQKLTIPSCKKEREKSEKM